MSGRMRRKMMTGGELLGDGVLSVWLVSWLSLTIMYRMQGPSE